EDEKNNLRKGIDRLFALLTEYLESKSGEDYDYEYDQVVSFGELWSTTLVADYLVSTGHSVEWLDIRNYLITDDRYRDADVLWSESTSRIRSRFARSEKEIIVTQGCIGGTAIGTTTTLGREGSDYTAAILANILDAEKVVVWKDVPGFLNCDPKWLDGAVRLGEISYKEAVEMSFSGAKVIHPKTIKPLHNKNIPLYIRSFLDPLSEGTVVTSAPGDAYDIPVFIRKENQMLISVLPIDFSFVMGDNLSLVFHGFMVHGIKVNLVQASAVSINVCIDYEPQKIRNLIEELSKEYKVIYNEDVEIITVMRHNPEAVKKVISGREILLEQKTRRVVRFVVRRELQN
ncbi:MAG: aspartate kinase, partial [Bacteroidales bacterium]|nr:aspartate kinase [Bacteroidales bacterium]